MGAYNKWDSKPRCQRTSFIPAQNKRLNYWTNAEWRSNLQNTWYLWAKVYSYVELKKMIRQQNHTLPFLPTKNKGLKRRQKRFIKWKQFQLQVHRTIPKMEFDLEMNNRWTGETCRGFRRLPYKILTNRLPGGNYTVLGVTSNSNFYPNVSPHKVRPARNVINY